jgi:hypothetical protein
MAELDVTRTLDTTPEALWSCVRDFGNLSWIPGNPKVEVRGEGVGQVRIIERPYGKVHERLTSLDDAARTLTYTVPEGMPFPVTDYEAKMVVTDDGGKGRLSWSCRFEPDGASADEVARGIAKRFRIVMGYIEDLLKEA